MMRDKKMMRALRLIPAALVLLLPATLRAQTLINGTFNTNANGWTLSSACSDAVWDGGQGNPPGSVRLNSCGEGNSDPRASQTITGLVVGTMYTVSVDIKHHAGGGATGKSFGIFLDAQPGTPLIMTEFQDTLWHQVTATFTAASTSAILFLAAELDARTPGGPGGNTDVSYYVDNVTVTEVQLAPALSLPAQLVLIALMAAAGALMLRRPVRDAQG